MPSNVAGSTIPTTATPALPAYTPEKQSPSFSGPINEVFTPVSYTNTTQALTVSDILGGLITLTNASAIAASLPSAAVLVPAIEGAVVGSSIELIIKNGGAGLITVSVGTGGSFVGTNTVATANLKFFLISVTALPDPSGVGASYTVYSLGSTPF